MLHISLDDYPSSYSYIKWYCDQNCFLYERSIGVQIDSSLKFHQYTSITVNKENRVLSVISKSFMHLEACIYAISFIQVFSLTHLGIYQPGMGPFFITDQQQIEKVQKGPCDCGPVITLLIIPNALHPAKCSGTAKSAETAFSS